MPFRPDRLKGLRDAKGFTQQALAALCPGGMHHTQITKYENRKAKPSNDCLESLAKALEVSFDYLMGDGDQDPVEAAIRMSFERYVSAGCTKADEDRCRRLLGRADAPRTVLQWQSFAILLNVAVGEEPAGNRKPLKLVTHKPRKRRR